MNLKFARITDACKKNCVCGVEGEKCPHQLMCALKLCDAEDEAMFVEYLKQVNTTSVDHDAFDVHGCNLLMLSSSLGMVKVVGCLLDRGVLMEQTRPGVGYTALGLAGAFAFAGALAGALGALACLA